MLIRNTVANLAGQLLYPLLALALVPFYLRRLGLEGYGLIGLMALVVSLLSVFSRGLGSALQREVSRRAGSPTAGTLRQLLRSMEVLYWILGAALAASVACLALTLGPRWVKAETLPLDTITMCLLLLALRVGISFPHSVYQSVFIGTERQVLGSALNAGLGLTAAAGGVLAVLVFGSVVAVYASEAIVSTAYLAIFRVSAFRVLPPGASRVDSGEIRGLTGLSIALMWTSGVGLLLSTLDRVFVSAALPVASLAVYTVAVMGGRVITLFVNPVLQAVYPGMCRAAFGSPEEQGQHLLHNAALIILVAAGVGVPLCGFAGEALTLWVADDAIVRSGTRVMSVYIVGGMLIAFASVFYQWQTATGRTGPAVTFNAVALLWFPLLLWILVSRVGLVGAAIAWTIYGALAWLTIVATSFGRGRLPRTVMHGYFRAGAAGLAPAVLATLVARFLADTWFTDDIWARSACGVVAGAIGAAAAAGILLPHLRLGAVPPLDTATALQPELPGGGLQ
ncbi:MAG: oligosaccharide flippase family protein [Vicinamibacterales bacterium]